MARNAFGIPGLKPLEPIVPGKPTSEKVKANQAARAAKYNLKRRDEMVPVEKAADGEETVVVDKKLQKLSLFALRQWEETLLYSPDEQKRLNVAEKVMNATGHGAREGASLGAGSIIVIAGLQQGAMPWTSGAKVVEGTVSAPPKIEAGPVQGSDSTDRKGGA